MIKNLTELEIKIGERVYKFLCAVDAPLGEVHDAVNQMKSFVVQKINEAHAASSPKEGPEASYGDPVTCSTACPNE